MFAECCFLVLILANYCKNRDVKNKTTVTVWIHKKRLDYIYCTLSCQTHYQLRESHNETKFYDQSPLPIQINLFITRTSSIATFRTGEGTRCYNVLIMLLSIS